MGGSSAPNSAATRSSISATVRSASDMWPRAISQRGLSGRLRRINQTMIAPTDPSNTTQRQPSIPKGLRGTRSHELGDECIDRYQLDPDADAGNHSPDQDSRGACLESHDDRTDGVP